jgi:hypothetical protein
MLFCKIYSPANSWSLLQPDRGVTGRCKAFSSIPGAVKPTKPMAKRSKRDSAPLLDHCEVIDWVALGEADRIPLDSQG